MAERRGDEDDAEGREGLNAWLLDPAEHTESHTMPSLGGETATHSPHAALPTLTEAVVVSDGDDDDDDDDEAELEIQQVRRLTAEDIRRQRMDAARAALRRAANAAPRRPPRTNQLLSTYKCSICLCPPTNVCITPCGHMFCGACLYDALAMQMRRDGHEWSQTDWLGVMGDPTAGRQTRTNNLFTPFGSGGALALANAAGVSTSPARELFSELVSQRQAQQPASPPADSASMPASRLRANNGTGKLHGHCPVCRTMVQGGFTGPARRGILGLDIMVGTPAAEPQSPEKRETSPKTQPTSKESPRVKRARVQ